MREEQMLARFQELLGRLEKLLEKAKAMEKNETKYQKLLARYQKLWGQYQALLQKSPKITEKYRKLLEFLLLDDGLTLEELADILGVSRQRVHQEITGMGINIKNRKPRWYRMHNLRRNFSHYK